MAAKRGRTITTFGAFLNPVGLSGGVTAVVVVPALGRVLLSWQAPRVELAAAAALLTLAEAAAGQIALGEEPL